MNRPSGFVPIPFRQAGRLFLAIGVGDLIVVAGLALVGLLKLPTGALIFGIAWIALGLYLRYVVPEED